MRAGCARLQWLRPLVLGCCSRVRGPRPAFVAGQGLPDGRAGPGRCSQCPSCTEEQPSGVAEAPSSLPSLPLGFRCTNPRGRTLPLRPARGTSPPPPLRWAPPAVRTPLKRRRPPCRVTPAITLDCPPILMSGMCEGSCCPATDWTKCTGNEERKRTNQANCSSLPRKWSFHTERPHRATPT